MDRNKDEIPNAMIEQNNMQIVQKFVQIDGLLYCEYFSNREARNKNGKCI